MYTVELIGAVLLIIHGLLLVALLDHIKSIKLLRVVNRLTKGLMVVYLLMIIARIGIYFRVHSDLVALDTKDQDQSFGNFLASYMADGAQAAMWITVVLMGCFGICFLFNYKAIKLS